MSEIQPITLPSPSSEPFDPVSLRLRLGTLDPLQIQAWQKMTPAQRLRFAFQAYQFALKAVRVSERRNHPDLSATELNWRITRRMQHNQQLGRPTNGTTGL